MSASQRTSNVNVVKSLSLRDRHRAASSVTS